MPTDAAPAAATDVDIAGAAAAAASAGGGNVASSASVEKAGLLSATLTSRFRSRPRFDAHARPSSMGISHILEDSLCYATTFVEFRGSSETEIAKSSGYNVRGNSFQIHRVCDFGEIDGRSFTVCLSVCTGESQWGTSNFF